MIGAICGDIIGSVHEGTGIKTKDFALFVPQCRFTDDTVAELRDRGHEITVGADWSQGRTCAVARDGDLIKAAATARNTQGYAFGR